MKVRRPALVHRRSDVIEWQATVVEGRVVLDRQCQTIVSSADSVTPAVSTLVEPCCVNPSSHAAVQELLRHVGRYAGATQYGGNKREWVA